jgi:hypothetical protein
VPSATPTGRRTSAAVVAAARAIVAGSRTCTGTGPAVMGIRSVATPSPVASTNASQAHPSPTRSSAYPSRSASTAIRNSSSAGTSGRVPTATLIFMGAAYTDAHEVK